MRKSKRWFPNVFIEPEHGITKISKEFVTQNIKKIEPVLAVTVYFNPNKVWYWTQIIGTHGQIWVSGFSLGYGGEGPHGLWWLLESIGFAEEGSEVEKAVFGGAAQAGSTDSHAVTFTPSSVVTLPYLDNPVPVFWRA